VLVLIYIRPDCQIVDLLSPVEFPGTAYESSSRLGLIVYHLSFSLRDFKDSI